MGRSERSMNLKNCRALVTGASSGIGAATARALADAGVHVVIVSERPDELNAVADSICAEGGRATAVVVDLADPKQVEGLFKRVEAQVGPIDLLVNNAGVGMG